jgi:hypothetical protein
MIQKSKKNFDFPQASFVMHEGFSSAWTEFSSDVGMRKDLSEHCHLVDQN